MVIYVGFSYDFVPMCVQNNIRITKVSNSGFIHDHIDYIISLEDVILILIIQPTCMFQYYKILTDEIGEL